MSVSRLVQNEDDHCVDLMSVQTDGEANVQHESVLERLTGIRLLVLDFDGVLTDNRVLVSEDGHESVWCSRADGMGIARLKEAGVEVIVISTETNRVVQVRCEKLGIPFVQGTYQKLKDLREFASGMELAAGEIAFVGNDVNDLECMNWVGMPIAVADAEPVVIEVALLKTERLGGYGAVREVAEWIIEAGTIKGAN